MILLLGMPPLISASICLNTNFADCLMPSTSLSCNTDRAQYRPAATLMFSLTSSRLSREVMSNQPGILKPRLSVMGMTGAVGQITFRWSGLGGEIARLYSHWLSHDVAEDISLMP